MRTITILRFCKPVLAIAILNISQASLFQLANKCPHPCTCHAPTPTTYIIDCNHKNLSTFSFLSDFDSLESNIQIELYINRNKIKHILKSSFFPVYGKLKILDISDNKNRLEIVQTAFESLSTSLEILKLSPLLENLNDKFEMFSTLISLKELRLSTFSKDGDSEVLKAPLFKPGARPLLETLGLHQCGINDIRGKVFQQMNLKTLVLSKNKLRQIPETVTSLMSKSLTHLDVCHNEIQQIKYYNIPDGCKLATLDLSFNHISFIDEGMLVKCVNLTVINLSHNHELVVLDSGVFTGLKDIHLDLTGISIRHFNFLEAEQVTEIKVGGTNLPCTCELQSRYGEEFGSKLSGTCILRPDSDSEPLIYDLMKLNLHCSEFKSQRKRSREQIPIQPSVSESDSAEENINLDEAEFAPGNGVKEEESPVKSVRTRKRMCLMQPDSPCFLPNKQSQTWEVDSSVLLSDKIATSFTSDSVARSSFPSSQTAATLKLDSLFPLPETVATLKVDSLFPSSETVATLKLDSFIPESKINPTLKLDSFSSSKYVATSQLGSSFLSSAAMSGISDSFVENPAITDELIQPNTKAAELSSNIVVQSKFSATLRAEKPTSPTSYTPGLVDTFQKQAPPARDTPEPDLASDTPGKQATPLSFPADMLEPSSTVDTRRGSRTPDPFSADTRETFRTIDLHQKQSLFPPLSTYRPSATVDKRRQQVTPSSFSAAAVAGTLQRQADTSESVPGPSPEPSGKQKTFNASTDFNLLAQIISSAVSSSQSKLMSILSYVRDKSPHPSLHTANDSQHLNKTAAPSIEITVNASIEITVNESEKQALQLLEKTEAERPLMKTEEAIKEPPELVKGKLTAGKSDVVRQALTYYVPCIIGCFMHTVLTLAACFTLQRGMIWKW